MPDEPSDQEQSQSERDAALLAALLLLIRTTNGDFQAILAAYVATNLTVVDRYNASTAAFALLATAHAAAVHIGRQRAGAAGEQTLADQMFGQAVAAEQAPFLASFLDDLRNGRYSDPMTDSSPESAWGYRADLYGRRLTGSAAAGWVAQQAPDALFTWHTTAGESCDTCAERDGQQYTQATLPGYPGDGSSECLSNCKCYLEVDQPAPGSAATSFELEGEEL